MFPRYIHFVRVMVLYPTQSFQPPYHFIVLPRAFHSIFFHLIVFFIEKNVFALILKIAYSNTRTQAHSQAVALLAVVLQVRRILFSSNTSSKANYGLCVCNEWHSFHARVGRFSPFLYLRSVAIAVILFWLQLAVLVSPCFLGSRIPRDYRFPHAPLFLCSERKPSSLTTGSSKLQFGDRQTRVKTVHYYSEDRNSRCDAT